MVLGKLYSYMYNEISTFSDTIHKLNPEWVEVLDVKVGTMKLLEEYIGRTLFDINHGNIFMDLAPRIM